jgi:thiol-disulfide isomerase/thioredoxin
VKNVAIIGFILLSFGMVKAQQLPAKQPDKPPFQRFPTIPPFNLLKVDSATYYTKDDLKKHRLTLIMCFSPECDHCKHQTRDIIAAMDKFKDIEIVMATFQPFPEMKEFYNYFRIADYPNIKIGRDEKYVLPPFYSIHNLPFLALYDKKGNLITTFEGNQEVEKILTAFGKADN